MFAKVIVDVDSSEVDRVFDYSVPDFLLLEIGDRVLVPFGSRKIEGFVMSLSENTDYDETKVKPIEKKLDDFTCLTKEMISLKDYMCENFFLRQNDTLRLFIPSGLRDGKVKILEKEYLFLKPGVTCDEMKVGVRKNAVNILSLIDYICEKRREEKSILNEKFSSSSVKRLVDGGYLILEKTEIQRKPTSIFEKKEKVTLTSDQKKAYDLIDKDRYSEYLLHGVTGSGKTEVYLSLIENVLSKGKTAIMLVPEISLTPQVMSSLKDRFGDDVALLHSSLSQGERFDEWRRLLKKEAKIAIGARSAIFAPVQNVGVIIIDEEHDSSYVSDSNPRYTTSSVASFRASFNSCPLVLGSATPSIMSYHKALTGAAKLLELPERINKKPLPPVRIVDMLGEVRQGGNMLFSHPLLAELEKCINNGEQAMLFLNRRGFSSFQMCRDCGYVAKCSDCDVSLVYHKEENVLKCHYCGKKFKVLTRCPNCGSENIKQGAVGTEKVVRELQFLFPEVKILRMDNDTTRGKDAHLKILDEFRRTKPSILVGTQMIAKGHDFPSVTVVGILDADQSLYQSDYRSSEKTFQLITQVSGRAGRSDKEGKVILQTLNPRHYVYKFASNYHYRGFFEKELNLREATSFPPYAKIVRVLISGENEEKVRETTKICFHSLSAMKERFKNQVVYFDAMKSPHKKIMKKFRYQILIRFKTENENEIVKFIFDTVSSIRKSGVSTFVEVDPQNLG